MRRPSDENINGRNAGGGTGGSYSEEGLGVHLRFAKWFLTDWAVRFRTQVITIAIVGFLGVTAQAGALGQLMAYTRALQKNRPITILGHIFVPHGSAELLFLFGGGILLTILVASGLIYLAGIKSIRLAHRYRTFCAERALNKFAGHLDIWHAPHRPQCDTKTVLSAVAKWPLVCGIASKRVLDTFVPVVGVIVYLPFLFYLNHWLTFCVLLLTSFATVCFYLIGKAGIRKARDFDEFSEGARAEVGDVIRVLQSTHHRDLVDSDWSHHLFQDGAPRRCFDAFDGRFLAVERATFASHMFMGLGVMLPVLVYGYSTIRTGIGWSNLIVYLVALRHVLGNIMQAQKSITGLNRLFPRLKLYHDFVRGTGKVRDTIETGSMPTVIPVASEPVADSLRELSIQPGTGGTVLITPVPLNRCSLYFICRSLLRETDTDPRQILGRVWFANSDYRLPPLSLKQALQLPDDHGWGDLEEEFRSLHLSVPPLKETFGDLDRPVTDEAWDSLPSDVQAAFPFLCASRGSEPWIFVDVVLLESMNQDTAAAIMNRLRDRVVFLVQKNVRPDQETLGEHMAIVIDGETTVGVGDMHWAATQRETINARLRAASAALGLSRPSARPDSDWDSHEDVIDL